MINLVFTFPHTTITITMEHTAQPREDAGSRTMTVTPSDSREASTSPAPAAAVGVLRLRGGPARRQRVVWSAETIDNEGMGKKKSKSELSVNGTDVVCCIYHKPRRFDESSSESDSCSSDDEGHEHCNEKIKREVPAQTEESEQSSESDGGGGDGRARYVMTVLCADCRPVRRPRKKPHNHAHEHDTPKANKYDSKGKSKA